MVGKWRNLCRFVGGGVESVCKWEGEAQVGGHGSRDYSKASERIGVLSV